MTFFSSSPFKTKAKWMSHSTSIWSLVTSINGAALIDLLQRFTDPLTHRKVTVGVFSKWFTRNQGERGQEYSSDSLVGELTDKMWLHDSEDNNKDNENNNDGTAKPGGARVQFWFIGRRANWQDVIARHWHCLVWDSTFAQSSSHGNHCPSGNLSVYKSGRDAIMFPLIDCGTILLLQRGNVHMCHLSGKEWKVDSFWPWCNMHEKLFKSSNWIDQWCSRQ